MKYKILLPSLLLFTGLFLIIINFIPRSENQKPKEYPNEWFFMQRAFPEGKINQQIYREAARTVQNMKKQSKTSSVWEFAGPTNIGGRITDVEMYPDDMETIFVGAASGGIFKTENAGNSWLAIFDDALSLSIGDMCIAPSNTDIIYVGTGEANAGGGSVAYDGIGIYKSMDAGNTWDYIGLEESGNIGRMVVHHSNPDIVYVAAMGTLFADDPNRGVFKTNDGGQSWENVLFISDSTGAIDIVMHPENTEILYAAMWERVRRPDRRSYGGLTCGIYKTTNGGQSWTELTNGLPSPGQNIGRIGLDISKSDPQTLYAIYADKIGYFEGVYKSTNNGEAWNQTNDGSLSNCYQSYGWWFGRIKIDPIDPDIAYVIGFDLYKTSSGGNSWLNVSSWDVHVDQHELVAHPMNNNFVVLGNDGGLYISQNGGNSWNWINNLPITQFYTCEIDHQFPQRLYGGTQDNGTNRTMTGNTDDWENIYGGDGFYVLVDPENNNYVYAEYQYGNFARSTNGGYSFSSAMNGINSSDRKNWNTPVVFDPTNPEILYYGANRLYRSTNRAVNWTAISGDLSNGPGVNLTYGTITTISVSPVNHQIIYAGTDDGNIWVSENYGTNWEIISSDLPERWITRITADPIEENTVYASLSGYRWNEYLPHVFRSENKGESWVDISGNLPEIPVNDLIVDPNNSERLYAATDVGVFASYDLGNNWILMGNNLPNVPVCDLVLHNGTRKLVAATYGRSMYSYDLYQDTLITSVPDQSFVLNDLKINTFPNPFDENFTIELESEKDQFIRISLHDMKGNLLENIFNGKVQAGNNQVDRTGNRVKLSDGIYLLRISSEKGIQYKKLISN
jgi:photosystem II stability/assembly factor-like uncharacterized protein